MREKTPMNPWPYTLKVDYQMLESIYWMALEAGDTELMTRVLVATPIDTLSLAYQVRLDGEPTRGRLD